ncbi:MAG: GntR family transcriptional regulator [Phycisphaeraceae bacterium]|nr:GntR family transcriptional regulator [Phycisphaeraceae bacterium]
MVTKALFSRRKPANANQLASQLRQALESGVFAEGDQLPTIRQLTDATGLPYNAVNRAFSILQAEGLLVSRKRAGTFVAPRQHESEPPHTTMHVFALIGPELSAGFYPSLQKGFDHAAGLLGYQIITSSTDNDVHVQADTILQLMDKLIAGVAIVPATVGLSPAHHIRQLQRQQIPVVLLHRSVEGVQAPLIALPAEKIGEMAGRQLIEAGHRRIAFCASQRGGSSLGTGYEQGIRRVLKSVGVEIQDKHVDYGDIVLFNNENFSAYESRLEQWFNQNMSGKDRPTAVFTSFESVGEIIYLSALRHGLRVPQDLSIITVGGQDRRGAIARRLASVTIHEQQAGQLTATLLHEMHQRRRPLDGQDMFEIEIGFDPAQSLSLAPV